MQNKKLSACKHLSLLLLLFLLLIPLSAQTCSAQPEQDKALSFIRDVIGVDVDYYKVTQTADQYGGADKATFIYVLEPKSPSATGESYVLYAEFNSGYFTSFSVQPDSNSLVCRQPRQDRFNDTLGIIERYQTWLNDSQVGEMVILLRQVGFEQSVFRASGNLSLRIQLSSDGGQYSFSNYLNGVEYSGVCISQSNSGSIFFTDNRGSQKIGNATIGVSEDQAIAIAQEYLVSNPHPGIPGSREITNLYLTGVKSIALKSGPRINFTLYPYYDIQFNVAEYSSFDGCGVSVDANAGEILSSHFSINLKNTPPASSNSDSDHNSNILLVVVVTVLVCTALAIGIYGSRLRFNVDPDTV